MREGINGQLLMHPPCFPRPPCPPCVRAARIVPSGLLALPWPPMLWLATALPVHWNVIADSCTFYATLRSAHVGCGTTHCPDGACHPAVLPGSFLPCALLPSPCSPGGASSHAACRGRSASGSSRGWPGWRLCPTSRAAPRPCAALRAGAGQRQGRSGGKHEQCSAGMAPPCCTASEHGRSACAAN